MTRQKLFDTWPEKYDRWFTTPLGSLVKEYEKELVLELLSPSQGERILDAGCGTGVFTLDILAAGAHIVGLDISMPMLLSAEHKAQGYPLLLTRGDMMSLPFPDCTFDKAVSVTALEFIQDAKSAVKELFRVTRHGGSVVVATLNSLSPWAAGRKAKAQQGRSTIFERAIFRSPNEIRALGPGNGVIKTAIHFQTHDDPDAAKKIELQGYLAGSGRGAFVAARWEKLI